MTLRKRRIQRQFSSLRVSLEPAAIVTDHIKLVGIGGFATRQKAGPELATLLQKQILVLVSYKGIKAVKVAVEVNLRSVDWWKSQSVNPL